MKDNFYFDIDNFDNSKLSIFTNMTGKAIIETPVGDGYIIRQTFSKNDMIIIRDAINRLLGED